ncbi:uncharacterized protein LOC120335668 isoform X2 [Styela clava]
MESITSIQQQTTRVVSNRDGSIHSKTGSFRKRRLQRQKMSFKEEPQSESQNFSFPSAINEERNATERHGYQMELYGHGRQAVGYTLEHPDIKNSSSPIIGRQDTEELGLTEEELERELEITVLNRMRNYLCDHLEPERFFPYLQTKEYLDQDSCEQIRNERTTKSRVNKMLDILIKSGPQPLKALIKAIQKSGTTQKFILEKLREENVKIHSNPYNLERLRQIRERMELTNPYHPGVWYAGPPPPYTPVSRGVVQCDATSSVYPASEFRHPASTPSLRSHPKSLECRNNIPLSEQSFPSFQLNNENPPFHPPPHMLRNYYPKPPINGDNSVVPSDPPSQVCPSHFQTSDFPPGSSGFMKHNPVNITASNEILREQIREEEKISLVHSLSGGSQATLTDHIATNQEKEVVKFQSAEPQRTVSYPWNRSPRTPTENDVSVVKTRSSPTTVSSMPVKTINSSNSNISDSPTINSPQLENISISDTNLSTYPKNIKSYQSCQNGSIQPSCFTSSTYGDIDSRLPTIKSSDATEPKPSSPTNYQPRSSNNRPFRPASQFGAARQFSTPLEPIPSVEVTPSIETIESFTIRRPPTEHEDASIIERLANDDEGELSSLEISTDSDSEQ